MATVEFQVRAMRYIPSQEVRYNGVRGHFWTRRRYTQGCWVYQGKQFFPMRATRKDIANPLHQFDIIGINA